MRDGAKKESALRRVAERYKFSENVARCLSRVYAKELEEVLGAMRRPGPRYYLRVNTLKTKVSKVLKSLREKGIDVRRDEHLEEAVYIEVEGPFEVPRSDKFVMVDKSTAESVMVGANVYAPGVLRCSKFKEGDFVEVRSELGEAVGSGVAKTGCKEALERRSGLVVEVEYSLYRLPPVRELEEYKKGWIYPQSLPAILTSKVLEPQKGELIVDMNCAPGGKLSHICQLTRNKARIVAIDRSEGKLERTLESLSRLGCWGVELHAMDSRYLDLRLPGLKADKCLVDPPCSALGVLPKIYDFRSYAEIRALSEYQKQFLKVASKVVREGGVVVYSVCTMSLEECEENVDFALRKCGLRLEEQAKYIGNRGITAVEGSELLQRFHPHLHGCGYFIAKFIKA